MVNSVLRPDPNTYRHRAPPGIGSSSASWTSARYPVRSSNQSARGLRKGGLLLVRGPEPLELDADLRVVAAGEFHGERVHPPRRDGVQRLARKVEGAGVAGAEELRP